ncbi:MAG TPA: BMP family ABC transporter substrate-binding protein [Gaiellaceae bacterium]|nr:BMP family ABC transporter substrate-binding protein [Gaiellaceae bacterium]
MRVSRWILAAVVAALAAAIAVGTALGGAKARTVSSTNVAVVTDIGGLNDKGFNHLAYVGFKRAQSKLGTKGRVFITQTSQDRLGNLESAAKDGYGLVIGVGFNFFQDFGQVDPSFPSTHFAGVDIDHGSICSSGSSCAGQSNYHGIIFREQEAGYLVGYIAGLMIHLHPHHGKQVVSAVGANPVPAIVHYLAGFRAGAMKANKHVKVLLNMANDPTFNDQTKCKVTTQGQISRGSGVVFEAAGGCGLGGLSAAKQAHIWGIGVDANQGFLGKFMLTSALKKVDVGVYDIIRAFKKNPSGIKGNADTTFTVKNGGVGYAPLSKKVSKNDRALITKKVNKIAKLIAKGKIKPPTTYPGA